MNDESTIEEYPTLDDVPSQAAPPQSDIPQNELIATDFQDEYAGPGNENDILPDFMLEAIAEMEAEYGTEY